MNAPAACALPGHPPRFTVNATAGDGLAFLTRLLPAPAHRPWLRGATGARRWAWNQA